jgi:hypothetical protein
MFGKQLRFLTMIGIAAGVPYVWFSERVGTIVRSGRQSWQGLTSSSTAVGGKAGSFSSRNPDAPAASPVIYQLADVLRFDVTPRWVTEQWSRVSTVRAEADLVGLRVPLVTGTQVDDFAGSLTYYFDANQRLRRLTLHGQIGDDRKLVQYGMRTFGLLPEPHLGAGIYLLRWNAEPLNLLRVTHAPVIRADEPYGKLFLEMEINDISAGYGLSQEFAELLIPDQHVRL